MPRLVVIIDGANTKKTWTHGEDLGTHTEAESAVHNLLTGPKSHSPTHWNFSYAHAGTFI